MNRRRFTGVVAGAWGLALFAAAGCGRREAAPDGASLEPIRVHVAPVAVATRRATEDAPGTVQSRTRATIEAKVMGRILRLPVAVGDPVREGDLLVELDAGEIRARLDQARARLEQAAREQRRMANLLARQAVTRREYDEAEAAYRVALAAVEEAQSMLRYTSVRAPFGGVVTAKFADVGDLAVPGKPLLVVDDPTALRVEVFVPESLIASAVPGSRFEIRAPALAAALTGTVREVAPAADPATRTFRVKLDLPPDAPVRLGQFVRVAVPSGEVRASRVPASALVRRGQLEMVFVVENGRAVLRLVKSGARVGDEIEILAGLEGGESVIADPPPAIVEGQPVETG